MARTRTHRLACGMPLLLHENHEVAVATADVWVRPGAADEPPHLAGVSHFLEHMLFKGTARFGLGEIEQTIERVGGVCNAGTSYDFTHYYVTLPSAAIGTGIEMLSEMVRHSTLDAAELEKERLVILEEWRRKQDYPPGILFERLYAEQFESGAYHDPVIGYESTIRSIDRDGMADYYRRRYGPGTMVFVVAGDFDPDAVIARAEAAFAGFDRPTAPLQPEPPQRLATGRRIHEEKPTGGELYVTFSFPAPGVDRRERIMPLEIVQCILGQGRASQLYQSLKEKRGLCSSIGLHFPTHLRRSLIVAVATCLPEQRQPLRAALLDELRAFAAAPPDPRAMARARRLLAAGHRFSLETSGGVTSQLGYFQTLTGDVSIVDDYIALLEAVTPEQVVDAAREIFQPASIEAIVNEVSVGPNGHSA